jgi:hypothetical protein
MMIMNDQNNPGNRTGYDMRLGRAQEAGFQQEREQKELAGSQCCHFQHMCMDQGFLLVNIISSGQTAIIGFEYVCWMESRYQIPVSYIIGKSCES